MIHATILNTTTPPPTRLKYNMRSSNDNNNIIIKDSDSSSVKRDVEYDNNAGDVNFEEPAFPSAPLFIDIRQDRFTYDDEDEPPIPLSQQHSTGTIPNMKAKSSSQNVRTTQHNNLSQDPDEENQNQKQTRMRESFVVADTVPAGQPTVPLVKAYLVDEDEERRRNVGTGVVYDASVIIASPERELLWWKERRTKLLLSVIVAMPLLLLVVMGALLAVYLHGASNSKASPPPSPPPRYQYEPNKDPSLGETTSSPSAEISFSPTEPPNNYSQSDKPTTSKVSLIVVVNTAIT
jgi:hypothetical protein